MTEPSTAAARMRDAAQIIEALSLDATPALWGMKAQHGRDMTDEGYSDIGVTDSRGMFISMTHTVGHETEHPHADASLTAVLRCGAPALVTLLREMADHWETDPSDGLCSAAALVLADAVLDAYDTAWEQD